MDIIKEFANWLNDNSTLSESSVYKYSHAVNTVSKEMLEKGIIKGSLFEMSSIELDCAIASILIDPDFAHKNSVGNNMYSNSLKQFRFYRNVEFAEIVEVETVKSVIENYDTLPETDRLSIIKSRIGQGVFKNKLLKKFESKCVVTGIEERRLLIASHVKPWAVCSNIERLSSENGLLLTPTYDKLFDSGLITFSEDGRIHFSSQISKGVIAKLHISEGDAFDLKMSTELMRNLQYHQDVVFVTHKRGKAV